MSRARAANVLPDASPYLPWECHRVADASRTRRGRRERVANMLRTSRTSALRRANVPGHRAHQA
eukprot:11178854-Lingulodinium_polyedra.AAC.1